MLNNVWFQKKPLNFLQLQFSPLNNRGNVFYIIKRCFREVKYVLSLFSGLGFILHLSHHGKGKPQSIPWCNTCCILLYFGNWIKHCYCPLLLLFFPPLMDQLDVRKNHIYLTSLKLEAWWENGKNPIQREGKRH